MADVFISYAKGHAHLTKELARALETEGFTTWWDTSLLPGEEFPVEIEREIDAAQAVIVIWTDASVESPWVRAEANRAYTRGKLITLHAAGLDLERVPLPFNTLQSVPLTDRVKVFAALERRGVRQTSKARPKADGTRAATGGVEEFVDHVWGKGAKRPSKRLRIALDLLSKKGMDPAQYAPPIWRFLWARGADIPPPQFMSLGKAALLFGTNFGAPVFFCTTFLGIIGVFAFSLLELIVFGGGLLGTVVAAWVAAAVAAYQRRRLGLPSWSDLASP